MPMSKHRPNSRIKLLLLGEGTVGKTTLKHQFLTGTFTQNYIATLGADFASHDFTHSSGLRVSLSIWDLAGQTSQAMLRKSFFSGARGALLLYDVTNQRSFEVLSKNWLEPLEQTLGNRPPTLLLANKVDLANQRVIYTADGEAYAEEMAQKGWQTSYIETSGKEGIRVNDSFDQLVSAIFSEASKEY